jgi:hypothetical protein
MNKTKSWFRDIKQNKGLVQGQCEQDNVFFQGQYKQYTVLVQKQCEQDKVIVPGQGKSDMGLGTVRTKHCTRSLTGV